MIGIEGGCEGCPDRSPVSTPEPPARRGLPHEMPPHPPYVGFKVWWSEGKGRESRVLGGRTLADWGALVGRPGGVVVVLLFEPKPAYRRLMDAEDLYYAWEDEAGLHFHQSGLATEAEIKAEQPGAVILPGIRVDDDEYLAVEQAAIADTEATF